LSDFLLPHNQKADFEITLIANVPSDNGTNIQSIQHFKYRKNETFKVSIESKVGGRTVSFETINADLNDKSLNLLERSFDGLSKKKQKENANLILCPTDYNEIKRWQYMKYDELHSCSSRIVDTMSGSMLIVEERIRIGEGISYTEFVERAYYQKGLGLLEVENFSSLNPAERISWKKQSPESRNSEGQPEPIQIAIEKGKKEKVITVTLDAQSRMRFKIYVEGHKYFQTDITNCDEYVDGFLVSVVPTNFQAEDGECGFMEILTPKAGNYEFYLQNPTKEKKMVKFRVLVGSQNRYYEEHPLPSE
jgi:hypothetical protein